MNKKGLLFIFCLIFISVFAVPVLCDESQNNSKENMKEEQKEGQDNKGSDNGNDKNSKDSKEGQDNKGSDNGNDKKEGQDNKGTDNGNDKKEEIKKPEDKIIIKKIKIGGDTNTSTEKKKNIDKTKINIKSEKEEYEYETIEQPGPILDYPGAYSNSGQTGSYYPSGTTGFYLDIKYSLVFTARYSLLGTYFSSTLESNYFTGEWKSDMLLTGAGGEVGFAMKGLFQKDLGMIFSLGYFQHSSVTNSFSDSVYSIIETCNINMLVLKAEVINYPRDWFYIKGGIGVFSYIIDTNVVSNMPGYTYTGLEGNTTDTAVIAGAGLDLELIKGFSLNLGIEGSLFIYSETKVKGLRDGLMPYAGISFIW